MQNKADLILLGGGAQIIFFLPLFPEVQKPRG
jgi:hypothetical protein